MSHFCVKHCAGRQCWRRYFPCSWGIHYWEGFSLFYFYFFLIEKERKIKVGCLLNMACPGIEPTNCVCALNENWTWNQTTLQPIEPHWPGRETLIWTSNSRSCLICAHRSCLCITLCKPFVELERELQHFFPQLCYHVFLPIILNSLQLFNNVKKYLLLASGT